MRTLTLNGKANILIREISDTSTQVLVNTRYIVEVMNRSLDGTQSVGPHTAIFTGKEVGEFDTLTSICKSAMTLENEILNNIGNRLGQ